MKKKKNNFSYGCLGSNDGNSILQQDRCVVASHLSPSVAWRRSQSWGSWQKDCVKPKGLDFDMAGWAETYGSVRGLLRWLRLSLPHSFEDSVGKHQEARVTVVPSPPGPDIDTW